MHTSNAVPPAPNQTLTMLLQSVQQQGFRPHFSSSAAAVAVVPLPNRAALRLTVRSCSASSSQQQHLYGATISRCAAASAAGAAGGQHCNVRGSLHSQTGRNPQQLQWAAAAAPGRRSRGEHSTGGMCSHSLSSCSIAAKQQQDR